MAIVRAEIATRTQEVRDAIIAGITDVMVANGARRENTQVILIEIPHEVWGHGGVTYDKRIAAEKAAEKAALEESS